MYICDTSLNSSYNEKCFKQKLQRKSKHTFYVQQLLSENRTLYEIMCKNMVDPATPQMKIRRIRFACWIIKATEYVILIAFPRQQLLRERFSVLRYTYIACLVVTRMTFKFSPFFPLK